MVLQGAIETLSRTKYVYFELWDELTDRFGKVPNQVNVLLEIINIKQLCKITNICKLDVGNQGISITFYKNKFSNPDALIAYITNSNNKIQIRSDHSIVILKDMLKKDTRIMKVKDELKQLVNLIN